VKQSKRSGREGKSVLSHGGEGKEGDHSESASRTGRELKSFYVKVKPGQRKASKEKYLTEWKKDRLECKTICKKKLRSAARKEKIAAVSSKEAGAYNKKTFKGGTRE